MTETEADAVLRIVGEIEAGRKVVFRRDGDVAVDGVVVGRAIPPRGRCGIWTLVGLDGEALRSSGRRDELTLGAIQAADDLEATKPAPP